ncbi:uncharacterized protein A4U43_C02F17860 [Asparagus officinalis]|uniref:Rx N-terminal domain-containing protein n=1 Tax=Asparagus officinalis TaxID=4686 RepID=A0A5P1FJR5_ASPOF|nr:uncharacterized protein A4U43_C02F17860 [Asparagus officinalis]
MLRKRKRAKREARLRGSGTKTVRELAYNTKDCIDEFKLHLDKLLATSLMRAMDNKIMILDKVLSFIEESKLEGIEKPRGELIGWLLEENEPQLDVISIVGCGGLGKIAFTKVY